MTTRPQSSNPSSHTKTPFFTTTLLALIIYFLTLAPSLTTAHFSGDGGELITAAVTLGVPHPPGYPTYTLLGHLISLIPIGAIDIAARFNFFSALTTALAVGLLADLVYRRQQQATVAIAAGLTLAYSPLIWSQATITEVYGLNLLAVAATLWSCETKRPFFLTTLLFGLSLTTHTTSLLLLPYLIYQIPRHRWHHLLLGTLIGLSPLLTLPILAQGNSPVVWGDPTTLAGWWWLVSGRLYHANLFAFTPTQYVTRLGEWLPLIATQFGLLGWLFIFQGSNRNTLLFSLTALLYISYAFIYATVDSHINMLPALWLLSIPLAIGLRPFRKYALLLPLVLLMLHFNAQNLNRTSMATATAVNLLGQAPANAIIMTPGDNTIFTLWYFQHVEEFHTDRILVDANLFAFPWYRQRLQQQHPTLKALAVDDLARFEKENNAQRPFCHGQLNPPTPIDCSPTTTVR